MELAKLLLAVAAVFILAAELPIAYGQTTGGPGATAGGGGDGGGDGGDGGGGIVGVGNTDVRCYTCDNVPDNDECNGVDLGENGTLTKCTYERSNCFSILKTNEAGDGYTTQKGCMEFDECYDRFYEMLANPIEGGNCMRVTLFGDDPIPGNQECFFCCFSYEGRSQDSCNSPMGANLLALPTPNNWDPAVDKWPGHEPFEDTTVAPTSGSEKVARPLMAIIAINMILVSALLA